MSDKSEACPVCGTVVGENPDAEIHDVSKVGATPQGQGQEVDTMRIASSPTKTPPKRKNGPIVWGIVALAVVVVGIFMLIKMTGKQGPENSVANSSYNAASTIDEYESNVPIDPAEEPVCYDIPDEYTYNHYFNDRFWFELDYPSFFVMGAVPENDDGRDFTYGNCEIASYGSYNVLDYTMEEILDESKNGNVTYSVVKDSWGVVSGIADDGRIYYIKQFIVGDVIYTLVFRYPQDQKSAFDGILKHVMKSYSFPLGYD